MADHFATEKPKEAVGPSPWWWLTTPRTRARWNRRGVFDFPTPEQRQQESLRRTKEKFAQDNPPLPLTASALLSADPFYKEVLSFMNDPSDPEWYAIFQKAQSGASLSQEEVNVINNAYRQVGEEMARMQEEEQEQQGLEGSLKGAQFMSPEKRAFEISQSGREPLRKQGMTSEDRFIAARQKAEGAAIQKRQQEAQRQMQELESKREALKGPREWMKYMTEIGETPSWLEYWMTRHA